MKRNARGQFLKSKPRSKSKSKTKTKRRSNMPKRRNYRRRARGLFSNKYVLGAALVVGSGLIARQFNLDQKVSKIMVGVATGNPIVAGMGIGEMIAPSLGGISETVGGWL